MAQYAASKDKAILNVFINEVYLPPGPTSVSLYLQTPGVTFVPTTLRTKSHHYLCQIF